jgi:hypothetical protein
MIQHPAALPDRLPGYWLEVKRLAQFQEAEANHNYSHWLLQPVTKDIQKRVSQPNLRHRGLLLVLFTAEEATARHDIDRWREKLIAKDLPVSDVHVAASPISDRHGNGACGVVLADLSQ